MLMRIRVPFLAGALLIGTSLTACMEPSEPSDAAAVRPRALTQRTITFDEAGVPNGTEVTDEFQAQGIILSTSTEPTALARVFDASSGDFPTASGANYLGVNTSPDLTQGGFVTATFVDACGEPTTVDGLSLYMIDSNPFPNPRAEARTFDADGAPLETRQLIDETELLEFSLGGIARVEFHDLGGDGHLVDDLTFTIDDRDPDGDGLCGDDDACPNDATCADLEIELTRSLLLTYKVDVRNLGDDDASDVSVHIDLPSGLTLSLYGGSGWSCSVDNGDLDCTRPALAAGTSAPALNFILVSLASGVTATVTAASGDPNLANNTDSVP